MKITVQINGKDTEIELTKEQVASIEAQNKPKKFEFKYSAISYVLGTHKATRLMPFEYNSAFLPASAEDGRLRLTQEAAEMSLARNKRANRLEALAEQLGGLREWAEEEENYYIYYTVYTKGYRASLNDMSYSPEKVYMTKECAIEICRMLNEGEFEL